jgi:hypothetical protein
MQFRLTSKTQLDPAKMNVWATRTSYRAGPQIWQEDGLVQPSNSTCSTGFYLGFETCRTTLYDLPHEVPGLGGDVWPPVFHPCCPPRWYIPTAGQVYDMLGQDPLDRLNKLGVLNNGEQIKAGNTLWLRDKFYLERQDLIRDNVSITASQLKVGTRAEEKDFLVADRCTRTRFPDCPKNNIHWGTSGLILWSYPYFSSELKNYFW